MTLRCPRCGFFNRDAARFCGQCGAAVPAAAAPARYCPQCGHQNRATARFCLRCGHGFQSSAPRSVPNLGTGQLPAQTMMASRYVVLKRVGKGGMGAVYRVADTRLSGKMWALKEMSGAGLPDPAERQEAIHAFQQEAQLLARLSHPNIPRVGDSFSVGDRQYLVMEFVEGETLQQRLERAGGAPLPPDQVARWACQLCEVLAYLHRLHPPIIFRDLKPSNIMITPQGDVKLIDFGIARFFKPGKRTDTMAFGTAGYAPPEQYGKGQTDARSDVYALGATLHHLLTGRDPSGRPFHFDDVCRLASAVPVTVGEAIMRAVAMRPADRWQSAEEMLQAMIGRAASARTAPPSPAVPCPALPSLGDLVAGTGLTYTEPEPGTFGVGFRSPNRGGVLLVADEVDDLIIIRSSLNLPQRGRDKSLEVLLRATYDAWVVKLMGSAKDGYLLATELVREQGSSRLLEVALRGLASMADLAEKHTGDQKQVDQAAAGCNSHWRGLPDRLGFDVRAVCQREGIPCSDLAADRYLLKSGQLKIALEAWPSLLRFFLLTDTKPRSNRRDAFFQKTLEANLRLKVTKVALGADGALAFIREAPVTGLDEEGFLQAFWGLLAAAEAFWEELEQI